MTPFQKFGSFTSKALLDWVRRQPCRNDACNAPPPSTVQHFPAKAMGGAYYCDVDVIPLCLRCHLGLAQQYKEPLTAAWQTLIVPQTIRNFVLQADEHAFSAFVQDRERWWDSRPFKVPW